MKSASLNSKTLATDRPLSDADRDKLDAYLTEQGGSDAHYVTLIRWAGMHPTVLARPAKHNLRIDGKHLTWSRPKKKGSTAWIRLPIRPEIADWLPEFIESLPKSQSVRTIERIVARVGDAAGLPGLSPRALRHTFLRWVADKFKDGSKVQDFGGVSPQQALDYIRMTGDELTDRRFLE